MHADANSHIAWIMVKYGTEPQVEGTGGEADGLVMALIERIYDREESVRVAIHEALHNIGKKQPIMVLTSCETYLHKHKKVYIFEI